MIFDENPVNRYNSYMKIPSELKAKYSSKPKQSQYLHSPAHLLADELSRKFAEPKRFGFYLKMAELYNHNFLRRIAGKVSESNAKNPGALFAYLIKNEKNKPNVNENT